MPTLSLLLPQLKVLGALEAELLLGLALLALETDDDLPGGLGLLVEDGLGLATEAHLLVVVPSLALGKIGGLASLVLRDLVDSVLPALLVLAVRLALLGAIHHFYLFIGGTKVGCLVTTTERLQTEEKTKQANTAAAATQRQHVENQKTENNQKQQRRGEERKRTESREEKEETRERQCGVCVVAC